MAGRRVRVMDANEATADVAYRLNEVVAIYPITPASPMGEHADAWSAAGRPNLWGDVPQVVEMQSEGGAAGTVHGALQAGALTTSFTASQGLLLMLPNLYKIAGELTPMVLHVAARSIATHALSIFGDHSDVYAARSTGCGLLAAGNPQEAHDLAAIAQAASLTSRIPFIHFFDGFRTSHELNHVELLGDDDLRALVDPEAVRAFRARRLTPDRPVIRGTAQNPDTFFQAREAANPFYDRCPASVQATMDAFAARTGRAYRLFEYVGHPEADRVVVMMGSGAEAAHETVEWLVARGERVGLVKVRLYRPFSAAHLAAALPASVRVVAALDRAKEPGAPGEPLYLDVLAALRQARGDAAPRVVGGRYGLSSKEFTPAMVRAVFEHLSHPAPRHPFTVGIHDDVTHLSLPFDPDFDIEPDDVVRAVFYGLGSDGTVGANKNSAKIIGEETDHYAQGYFVYDSRKAGAMTVSHLRFGPRPVRSTWLIERAGFVACHQWSFLERVDVLERAAPGATLLLNAPVPADVVWDRLPREVQAGVIEKGLEVWAIDAHRVAREAGLRGRINTVMQACFFALSGVLPRDEALARIREKIRATYAAKGEQVVETNLRAVDEALAHLHRVPVPGRVTADHGRPPVVPPEAPDFVQRVTAVMLAGHGDRLPVSAFPPDGTWPLATSQWEKRNIAHEIPAWDPDLCIQCNKCAAICPHAAIRTQVYDPALLAGAPEGFPSMTWRGAPFAGRAYTVQVAPEDCTGCGLCVSFCPARDKKDPARKALAMTPLAPVLEHERARWAWFAALPDPPRAAVPANLKGSQLRRPLFEFPSACAGCGETPYIKLLTQLFGDRALIANATGCSSIYGGNLPTTPYCVDAAGRGPAWSNSLFEDNAEFGLGLRVAIDQRARAARARVERLAARRVIDAVLARDLLEAEQRDEAGVAAQRERVAALRSALAGIDDPDARALAEDADDLVRKSVWIVGGDGWAYDIGYGGLDHVLASGADVNILVLDTEVYSNTGGQQSKATPRAAVARFAADGKARAKKDLALLAMMHEGVYVARVALGARDAQTYRAFVEAESWPGPSLILAYSHCIAHGYDMAHGADQQRLAVDCGHWPLLRRDPRRAAEGRPPLVLDSPAPKVDLARYAYNESRYRALERRDPERARALLDAARADIRARYALLQRLAAEVTPSEAE